MLLRMRTQHLGAKIVFENTCGGNGYAEAFFF